MRRAARRELLTEAARRSACSSESYNVLHSRRGGHEGGERGLDEVEREGGSVERGEGEEGVYEGGGTGRGAQCVGARFQERYCARKMGRNEESVA